MAKLTDTKIRNAKPGDRPIKLSDGQGLYLDVRPTGAKIWRYRYWLTPDRDGIYTIGEYPTVSLSDARKERERIREIVRQGQNPTQARKMERVRQNAENRNTFEAVAREWIDHNRGHWSPTYLHQVETFLGRDVFPAIGDMPIRSVAAGHILPIMRTVEKRGAQTIAILIRQWTGQIFRYAVSTLRADTNPAAALEGAIKRRPVRHHPPLKADEIPEFLSTLAAYQGNRETIIAARLMMRTFVRTVELRLAKWTEFDLDAGEWRIPAERLKMRRAMRPGEVHIVPLSRQAVAELRELFTLTGDSEFLFPNIRDRRRCMTSTTINRALERMGYGGRFSGHGFRSTASTILHEHGYRSELIELQLAHMERDKVKAAYNHAKYLPERRSMMQEWSDWIDSQEK